MQAPFIDPLSAIGQTAKSLPLFGRDSELQAIRKLLDTVEQDRPVGPRALIVSGDVGVGKSRLLAAMRAEAQKHNFQVLEGRAYESGGRFPYLPFIEALRPVLRSTSVDTLRAYVGLDSGKSSQLRLPVNSSTVTTTASLSPVGSPLVAALARLFPELPALLDFTIIPEILSADQEKFRLFDAIATLLERMATAHAVMVCIDNLQWADSTSLELTMYLTMRLHDSRVVLVGATRPPASGLHSASTADDDAGEMNAGQQSAVALRALSELMRQGLLLFLPLQPLSIEATECYLHELLPGPISDAALQSLLARAEGNPFFLEELVRSLTLNNQLVQQAGIWRITRSTSSELPRNITLAVEQRLHVLSAPCLDALRIAALFGRTFPFQALAAVLQAHESRVQALIDEAEQATLITRVPARDSMLWDGQAEEVEDNDTGQYMTNPHLTSPVYMFCQGIVQEVLSNQLPLYQARTLHGEIGAVLESYYSTLALAYAAELARHYVLSGKQQEALRWSLLAGKYAARQQAHREAIGQFRTVLKLWEAGIDELQLPGGQPMPSRAQIYLLIGESWFKLGELVQAGKAFQQALEEIQYSHYQYPEQPTGPTRITPMLSAQANRLIADVYRMQGKYELALAHLEAARNALNAGTREADAIRSTGSTTERILLLQAQATLDLLRYHPEEAEEALWQSHQLAAGIGDRGSQAFALHLIGWIRGWGERIHEAIRLQEQAHELYVAIGDPFRATLGDQGLGIIYQAIGEMEKARLHNLRGIEQARRYGVRHVLGWLYWNMGILALFEGNWATCESQLQQALLEAETTGNTRLKPVVMQAQAELLFRRGDWLQAEQSFQLALQAAINTEWYASTMALYGHFLAVTGHKKTAKAHLERAAALPEPSGYAGHFYIPFLAEGFLHLDGSMHTAITYIKRIQTLRGFLYYGVAVDRILGEVAALNGDWDTAERAFEDGLMLCRRVHNEPEEAFILYEQARTALLRTSKADDYTSQAVQHIHNLCAQARELFLRYDMQRAALLVDTFQEGVLQLEAREHREQASINVPTQSKQKVTTRHGDYILDLHLTKRELEVLRLVAEGHTDREVADALVISPRTVNRHLSNIFVKLDVPGRAAAVAYAIRQGLVG
jgi:DNA-binding CsgD family transcriptional regulator/tetratricopeptide (TPR) repeat protein